MHTFKALAKKLSGTDPAPRISRKDKEQARPRNIRKWQDDAMQTASPETKNNCSDDSAETATCRPFFSGDFKAFVESGDVVAFESSTRPSSSSHSETFSGSFSRATIGVTSESKSVTDLQF
jgi:hypothetical protein